MERHRQVLETALRLVADEGLGALTMQRLADEIGIGVGSVYRAFPSKDALIAELQRASLDVLTASLLLSQAHLDELLSTRHPPPDRAFRALAKAVGAARFWISADGVYPRELELSKRLFVEPGQVIDDEEGTRVFPAAMRLLAIGHQLLEEAAAHGALEEGSATERAILLVAGSTGVLLTTGLERWDDTYFDGRRLARRLIRDLFRGWGAGHPDLDAIDDLLAPLAEQGRLVPEILR
jgi:AcrR family transcriptional regulator